MIKLIRFFSLIALVGITACSSDDDITQEPEVDLDITASRNDVYVKTSSLPQGVFDYIVENYPGQTIKKAELESDGTYEVELLNGTELIFSAEGAFLGIDDDDDDDFGDREIPVSELPQAILDFVQKYFPGATIEEAEKESNGNFEIELSNDEEIIFDADGKYLGKVDNDDDLDQDDDDIPVADLPQAIKDYIAANYADFSIIEAEKESDGTFEITLSNGIELIFDAEGNFVEIDD